MDEALINRATLAAEASARWAFWQMLIAGGGTAGLALSLLYTSRSLGYGRESVKAAQQQLTIAQQEMRENSVTTERQLRAYLIPKVGKLVDLKVGSLIKASIPINNDGQTPAQKVTTSFQVVVHDMKDDVPPITIADIAPETGMIGSGADLTFTFLSDIKLTAAMQRRLKARQACVMVMGVVEYEDIFGERRRTRLTQHFYGGGALDGCHTIQGNNDFT